VQFRPVGIERPDEELAPERAEFAEQTGGSTVIVRYPGRRCQSRHDKTCLFIRRLLSRGAPFAALTGSFGRQLLKEGFNCCYPYSYW
jgi:hypothetical protein